MRRLVATVAALAVVMLGCGGSEESDPGSKRTERSSEQLAADWWVWAGKRPEGQDPVSDPTGANCRVDQPKDVFFLAGTFGGTARRRCTVPAGRRIFFPVLNTTCTFTGGDPAAEAAACGESTRGTKRAVKLDGRKVSDQYLESQPFRLAPHPASPMADFGGRSVAAGWYVTLPPLSPGRHQLGFMGKSHDGLFVVVRYVLTVRGADASGGGV